MKWLLFPLSALFRLGYEIRKLLYHWKIKKRVEFDIPVICIGNIRVGGTGKTPHTLYIAQLLLKNNYKVAILSRGYKRKTKGFIWADENSTALTIGDEPMIYKNAFRENPNAIIAVCENRRKGIFNIINGKTPPDIILLDDAFQHWKVKAGLEIILSDYYHPFYKDRMLPGGRLREPRKAASRADLMVVSKSPKVLSPLIEKDIADKVSKYFRKTVYFSFLQYQKFKPLYANSPYQELPENLYAAFILAGIANPYPLEEKIRSLCVEIDTHYYPDHHDFSEKELDLLIENFRSHVSQKKAIITTEKDAQRLQNIEFQKKLIDLPVFFVPIEVSFHQKRNNLFNFDQYILDYAGKNSRNNAVHSSID